MPLVAENLTCTLWLFTAVLGLGWAQNVPNNSGVAGAIFPTRGSPFLETIKDPRQTMKSAHIRPPRAASGWQRRPCSAPRQPMNGEWRIREELCGETIADCKIPEGTQLEPTSQLVYSCNSGYKMNGNADVICQAWGRWTTIPACVEIKCPTLNSVERTASCFRFRDSVSCDFPVPPKTRAELSCRPGYKTDTTYSIAPGNILDCSEEGKWEPEPFRCVPVCGKVTTRQTPFVTGGTAAKVVDFPWHATLYTQENGSRGSKKLFKCGASIIHPNLLLTAGHCVYDERYEDTIDPQKLFVLTGNTYLDYDSPQHDYRVVRRAKMKNIHLYCTYYGLRGNYVSDIALLELEEPFVLSQILMPVCLDRSGYSERFLETRPYGKVAGFGRTDTEVTSPVLRTVAIPYIPYNECLISRHAAENHEFITLDKFCAGWSNGSGVSDGDSGGGLVFQRNELWYVMGIVSVGLGVDVTDGEKKADRYSYSLYTKVSTYIDWIHEVIYNLEKFKEHRPCKPDSKAPTTQTPSETRPLITTPTVDHDVCHVECTSVERFARLPEGYVAYPDIGFAYKVYDQIVSWVEARKRCIRDGARLALIDTIRKLEYVRRQKNVWDYAFVGILRMYDETTWVAISTGSSVTALPWAKHFPQAAGDCVLIGFPQNGLGNHPCTHEHNYICEIPIAVN